MTKDTTPDDYRAYLLRIWLEQPAQTWRATLKDARSGRERHFASLAALVDYLQTYTPLQGDAT